nr:IS5 family transposase [Rhizobium tropici]
MPFKHNAGRHHRIGKMKFKVTNWSECEAGLRRRGSLTLWMIAEALSQWQAPKRTTRGGQPRYSDLAIETALTLGLVFGLRLRQTEGLLISVLQLMGLALSVPDHTTLSRRAGTRRSPDTRQGRGIPGEGPVNVLIDSTGLEVYGAGQWQEEKQGVRSRRSWRKLHLAPDADSGEIIAHIMTDQDTGDASQVEPLLDQVDISIGQFTADGAFDGKPTYDAVSNHSAGAAIVVPPRQRGGRIGHQTLQSTKPSYRGDRHGRPDAVASRHRLWQAFADRDRDRQIQVDHRSPPADTILRGAKDRGRHRLRRPQSNVGMCTPEIRPSHDSHRIDENIKDWRPKYSDPCTNAVDNRKIATGAGIIYNRLSINYYVSSILTDLHCKRRSTRFVGRQFDIPSRIGLGLNRSLSNCAASSRDPD